MRSDDVESAYFAVLRARDEVADLRRYQEYLGDEARRLRRASSEAAALAESVNPRLRRRLLHTDGPLGDAVRLRLEVLEEELKRVPAWIADAEQHVTECEAAHDRARDRA